MSRKALILSTAALLVAAAIFAGVSFTHNKASADIGFTRLGGSDRIETSLAISAEGWGSGGTETAVICNGFSFPDAMAGVPLAAKLDAPILLTRGTQPEQSIIAQLDSLGVKNIYILGGEGVITADFADALCEKGCNVTRISGADRYSTANAIASYLMDKLGVKPDSFFLVSGINFPDALSVSPAAGVLGQPILYTNSAGDLPSETARLISGSDIDKAVIVGGTGAVPEAAEAALSSMAGVSSIERISGSDRYQTSLAVNKKYNAVLTGSSIALACGDNFPDALAGGAFAAKNAMPLVLMNNWRNVDGAYEYVTSRTPQPIYVFGMEGALTNYAVSTFISGGTITTTTTTTTTTRTAVTATASTASSDTKYLTSSGGVVNVRSDAGTAYSLTGSISSGSYYEVLGSKTASDGVLWYKIKYNGSYGYVCSTYVTLTDSTIATHKVAYLTFDDGPSKNTGKILDILDRYGVKATFFVIYHSGMESTYKAIVNRGHTIALHSYSHDYAKIYSSKTAYFNDLDKISNYVESLTGVRSTIIRFPGGSSNTVSRTYCSGIMTALSKEVISRGYQYYDWNVDSGDADGTTIPASTLVSNIKNRCGSQQSIMILMHDASAKTTTVDALPEIIEYLQSKGYDILPITNGTPGVHHGINN